MRAEMFAFIERAGLRDGKAQFLLAVLFGDQEEAARIRLRQLARLAHDQTFQRFDVAFGRERHADLKQLI